MMSGIEGWVEESNEGRCKWESIFSMDFESWLSCGCGSLKRSCWIVETLLAAEYLRLSGMNLMVDQLGGRFVKCVMMKRLKSGSYLKVELLGERCVLVSSRNLSYLNWNAEGLMRRMRVEMYGRN